MQRPRYLRTGTSDPASTHNSFGRQTETASEAPRAEAPSSVVDFTPDPELFPFQSRWFESSVGPIHYVDEGEGRPLILFHGNPDWSFLYRKIIVQLRGQFRCIAMDYPGFGLSVHPGDGYGYTPEEHAEAVGELIDHLDLSDAIVMGADWGGPIGLEVASRRADRVSGLVIGNTWAWPAEGGMLKFFSRLMSSRLMQRLITRRNFFVNPAMKRSIEGEITDAEFEHYTAVVPTPEHRRGIAQFPKQIRAAGPFLAELERRVTTVFADTPLVLIWGTKDPVFRAILPGWERRFPDATVIRLDNASHYLQEDEPNRIADAIATAYGPNRTAGRNQEQNEEQT
ncbi:MAG: alpha/beta fold hydrolase [Actinomycetota bacterium]